MVVQLTARHDHVLPMIEVLLAPVAGQLTTDGLLKQIKRLPPSTSRPPILDRRRFEVLRSVTSIVICGKRAIHKAAPHLTHALP